MCSARHPQNVVIRNGAASPEDATIALCAEVERQLEAPPDVVRTFHLTQFDIGHCLGEFDCLVKMPGRCHIHDEGQEIERAVHDADMLVVLTPLRHGGYAPDQKALIPGRPGYAQLLLRIGTPTQVKPPAPRRPLLEMLMTAP